MSLRADLAREDELLLARAQLGVLQVELVQLPRIQAHLTRDVTSASAAEQAGDN